MISYYGVLHVHFNVEQEEEEVDFWNMSAFEQHVYQLKNPDYVPPENPY